MLLSNEDCLQRHPSLRWCGRSMKGDGVMSSTTTAALTPTLPSGTCSISYPRGGATGIRPTATWSAITTRKRTGMSEAKISPQQLTVENPLFIRKQLARLKRFRPEHDYLALLTCPGNREAFHRSAISSSVLQLPATVSRKVHHHREADHTPP